jgi:hypothetical protein
MRTECLFYAAEFSALGSRASEIIADGACRCAWAGKPLEEPNV